MITSEAKWWRNEKRYLNDSKIRLVDLQNVFVLTQANGLRKIGLKTRSQPNKT